MPAKSPNRSPKRTRRHSERGYILITIIFAFAVMAIVATMLAPSFIFEMKRDREEEMIHRGAQYARAIRAFVKKNGRYPTRIEDLDNTNQIRYLRRHYKDPITGKEFRLLHQGDVPALSAGLSGAAALGANGLAGAGGIAGAQGVQQQAAAQIAQGLAAGQAANTGTSLFGASEPNANSNEPNAQSAQTGPGAPDNGSDVGNATAPGQPQALGQNQGTSSTSLFGNAGGNQAFGGGPIVGVASISKDKSIRIFNKKDHYKDWYFIYDPTTDRGALINGPAQPALQGGTNNVNGPTPGQNGSSPAGPGGSTTAPGGTFNGLGGAGNQNNNNGPGGFQPPGQLPEQ
jgi:type II secretory pathway pseudopilin PulG